MVGIVSYGAYIPLHRISREEFFNAWGGFAIPGEKAVANFDEDSITMAVEAALDSLRGLDQGRIDALFFASTTSPYKEKLGSAIIATVLDLPPEVRTADFAGSLRVGTTALAFALDAIKAGSVNSVLLAVADTRLGAPAGDFEQTLGDGAAALLLGKEEVIAEIKDSYSIYDEFSGVWRADGDTFLRSWEDRMVLDEGYSRILPQAISGLMEKCNLKAKDFAKAVYDAPTDVRRHARVAAQLGFEPSQVQDPLFMTVGNTGAALATMMLVAALEEAKPGDRILFASYGNGADAFVLEVTPAIEKLGQRRGIRKHLESKRMIKNYQTYLRWRGLLTLEAARRPEQAPTSIAELWRHRREILALYGARCTHCGTPQYNNPGGLGHKPARICVVCQARDRFEPYRFADKRAEVFTFTQDNLTAHADPPATVAVVDFEGGGRAEFEMTDRDPAQVEVGMPVEMTFRKLYHDRARGIHNYYWKIRPVRC
ncbi:MAG: hydroxymethylglutaryl-CoA synthase [Chloroflexi bacterium]|nr:MAG: hydroxymethylglutaryl-CoA synthase [Chloroflexota bacterium]